MNFTAVAKLLRKHLAAHPPIVVGPKGRLQLHPESRIARDALVGAESEFAAQSILYLYDHLTAHEQWRKAATLVARCLPFTVLDRPDIRALIAKVSTLADKVETPEKELGHYLDSSFIHELPDFMADPSKTTPRAAYWVQIVRLREADRALEWGCGAGVHVMQAAQLFPDVAWWGADEKPAQIDAAIVQARRLGPEVHARFILARAPLDAPFPVVALLDTIEHTVHPEAMLDKVEWYVAPGGVVVVTVPNGPWSLHTASIEGVNDPPGNHVNVQHAREFIPFLERRGAHLLDARVIPGQFSIAEGNETLAVTYKLGR